MLKIIFIILIQLLCADSFAQNLSAIERSNEKKLNDIFCHYQKSIALTLNKHGFIPNSLNVSNGRVTYDADVVQPRFLQIANNVSLLAKSVNGFADKCYVSDVTGVLKKSFDFFSSDYKEIFPHVRHIDLSMANEFDRNIYELGDWMGVSLVNSVINHSNQVKAYNKKQADKLFNLLSVSDTGLYTFEFVSKNKRFEVGHLTLAIDSLSLYSFISKDMKYVNLSIKLIEQLSNKVIFEDQAQWQYTHLATYGEIFESLTLARFVQGITYQKDPLFEKLYGQMKLRFSDKDNNLKYVLDKNMLCYHSLAFEGAFYRPLLYFHYNNNKSEVDYINKQVSIFEKILGTPPLVGKCINAKYFDDLNYGALGVYYMYLKLKRIQSILGYDQNAEHKIQKVLNFYQKRHKANFFAKESSVTTGNITKDMGGNVWFFNEGVVPLMHSYKDPNSLVGRRGSFQGCNYYYMPGFK